MNPDSIKTGGPAFPTESEHQSGHTTWHFEGMSLRDYFAAKAMHQFLAGAVLPVGYDASQEFRSLAGRAYEAADAMLAARTQNPEAA